MTPGQSDGPSIDIETPVQNIMHQIDSTHLQVTEHGKPVGIITQSSLIARLTPASFG
jgi:glycine betaine/proline transport system ATP-binding protein